MAALHPETEELLRKTLADLAARHKQDLAKLARLKIESRSLMAQKLRARIAATVPVMRDLEQILPSVRDVAATPAPELDRRAQWIADARAVLDLLETNPDLPLNLATGFRIGYHPLMGDDAEAMAAVDAVADMLGVTVTLPGPGSHYEATIRLCTASYEACAVLTDFRERRAAIDRLGEAALAAVEQEAAA